MITLLVNAKADSEAQIINQSNNKLNNKLNNKSNKQKKERRKKIMANIEQKVADTLELVTLTSKAVLENENKLDAVDANINGVGQSVVKLHKTSDTVIARINEQGEILKEMNENQEFVHESTEKLTETIKSTLNVFEENRDVLESIKEDIKSGNESEENTKTELLSTISDGNQKYTDKVDELLSSMDKITDEIIKLDVHDDINVLQQKLDTAKNELDNIHEFVSKTDNDAHERLDAIEDQLELVTTGLNELTTETQKINLAFETAIARMNNIDLKLDAVVDTEDDDENYTNKSEVE